ncbi:MAG: tRNA 2-thiouridine(34) synthase MnmA, partial [Candidatus Omnitrophica bacterium]|nr:tRNA 2-thiouridine(34) synthase MnmA [Candidatus Omnitrophota bacterium]
MTRIVVAMSGGVDSSVAALELKEKGFDVIGITMKTWPKEECGTQGDKMCCSLESVQYARSAAEDIGIPHYVVDLSKEFQQEVTGYFIEEYKKGRTPNPCVYCNSRLKFGYLLDKARQFGAEKIATGHYANIIKRGNGFFLSEGHDKKKDQSYFLYDIPREKLAFVEFPLGTFTKTEVREKAALKGLMNAGRKESQDVCFVDSGGDYRQYLEKKGVTIFNEGDVLDVSGKVIGRHKGIAAYTVGQRKGLGIAGKEPVYVIKIDAPALVNIVNFGSLKRVFDRGLTRL